MTLFQFILLALTLLMVIRQVLLVGILWTLLARYGRVNIRASWWAHLVATVVLVLASVASFVGVSA